MKLPVGFRIGHWTDTVGLTGCTVVLCPPKTVGACDVRGSSPGSRELALLAPDKTMQEVHAVLLSGGSAFGLAAADGVMRYLEERGIGYATPWIKVPIVPAAVVFDLNIGSKDARPDAASGYAACKSAAAEVTARGTIGAGTGATVGKWAGIAARMKGGFGVAVFEKDGLCMAAAAVVNAVGDVLDESGGILAGARTRDGVWLANKDPLRTFGRSDQIRAANTTLVVIMTNSKLTKVEANRLAQRAHDGMARAIKPVHTSYDGDVVFCLASGEVIAGFDILAELGADLTSQAIRNAVQLATSVDDVPSAGSEHP
jgi:L-aminopeptidase/D-esterase-like protein